MLGAGPRVGAVGGRGSELRHGPKRGPGWGSEWISFAGVARAQMKGHHEAGAWVESRELRAPGGH